MTWKSEHDLDSALFQLVFENARAGVVVVRPPGIIERANVAFCQLLGYEPGALNGRRVIEITAPADWPVTQEVLCDPCPVSRDIYLEKRYRHRDGSVVWTELSARWLLDERGIPRWLVALVFDIHQRKIEEQRISDGAASDRARRRRLQGLASELTVSGERERRQLAEELHDQVGQALAVANLRLARVLQDCVDSDLARELGQVQRLVGGAIRFTRSLTFELSPPLLHQLGLAATLEWLAEQQAETLGVDVVFHHDGRTRALRDEVQILLFRSVRELLINVAKHANARHAQVRVRREAQQIVIEVEDDGVGIAQTDPLLQAGFGLYSIRERLEAFGGEMEIVRRQRVGTRVTLRAPLDTELEAGP